MRLNYEEVQLIVKSYDKFEGNLLSVKSDFYNKTGRNIEYEHIIKVIYKVNSIMKRNVQKKLVINNAVSDLFSLARNSKVAV